MSEHWKSWARAAGVRALKTVAQTAVAMGQVNWIGVASTAALAGVLSLLTSVAGLPEVRG